MWKFTIKLNGIINVRGQAHKKEDCILEAMHYASLYLEESFDKAVIEIKKDKKDVEKLRELNK